MQLTGGLTSLRDRERFRTHLTAAPPTKWFTVFGNTVMNSTSVLKFDEQDGISAKCVAWQNCIGNFTVGEERKIRNGKLQHPSHPFTFVFLLIILLFLLLSSYNSLRGFNLSTRCQAHLSLATSIFHAQYTWLPSGLHHAICFFGRPLDLFPTGLQKSCLPFSTSPSCINGPTISILIIISMCVFQV
jgi:hypothetical protein